MNSVFSPLTSEQESFSARIDPPHSYTEEHLDTMQLNIGRKCNLSCVHCHLECGPQRNEAMNRDTMLQALDVFEKNGLSTLDITGGSPEMNPDFEWLLCEARCRGIRTLVRTNLCIMDTEEFTHFPALYAELGVEIEASMPCYTHANVDAQRGCGSYNACLDVIGRLNRLGYGTDPRLVLNFVFNPSGPSLPGDQTELENDYKKYLGDLGVVFNRLYVIVNNPIGRFGKALEMNSQLNGYMELLTEEFNADTLEGMMCRTQLSVGWDGTLYDCDFNQALGVPIHGFTDIKDYTENPLTRRPIGFGQHCYACTAGYGSSCKGSLS